MEQVIYRIAQESIANVSHHAQAKKLCVRLSHNGQSTTLIIEGDGISFDTEAKVSTGHFGLIGMKERAELAGGKLTIESEKGRGMKVVLKICLALAAVLGGNLHPPPAPRTAL